MPPPAPGAYTSCVVRRLHASIRMRAHALSWAPRRRTTVDSSTHSRGAMLETKGAVGWARLLSSGEAERHRAEAILAIYFFHRGF